MVKRNLTRSQPYPAFTIQYCIEGIVNPIYDKTHGGYYIQRDEIANILNISESNTQLKVSSAVQYGLLDKKQGEGYKPSDLFVNIYLPTENDPEKHNQYLIECIRSPKLYKQIFDLIGDSNKVPPISLLQNRLIKDFGIAKNVSRKAASIFIENIDFVGLWENKQTSTLNLSEKENDREDELELEENGEGLELFPTEDYQLEKPHKKAELPYNEDVEAIRDSSQMLMVEVGLTERKKAVLKYPDNINEKDLDILESQLKTIRLQIQ